MASPELKTVVWLDAFDKACDQNLIASLTPDEQAEALRLGRLAAARLDARDAVARQRSRAWRVQRLQQVAAALASNAATNPVNFHLGALPHHTSNHLSL